MNLSTNARRAIAACAFMTTLIQVSGCVTPGATQHPRKANSDSVDICYTRATHTECFQKSASDYAEEVQLYQERLEMESMERSEDW